MARSETGVSAGRTANHTTATIAANDPLAIHSVFLKSKIVRPLLEKENAASYRPKRSLKRRIVRIVRAHVNQGSPGKRFGTRIAS